MKTRKNVTKTKLNDTRDKFVIDLERKIQDSAVNKDKNFHLNGPWKQFVLKKNRFKIFKVDGKWVYNNLSAIFSHGGHGLVHEFIPNNEIWIGDRHFNCRCKNVIESQKVSKQFFDSVTWHEIVENKEMKKGKTYWQAHNIAEEAEVKLGLLTDL